MASSTKDVLITIKLEAEETEEVIPKPKRPKEVKNLKSVLFNQAFDVAQSLVIQGVQTTFNRYVSLKEDYITEQKVTNTINTINKISQIVTITAAGVKIGGVIGGAIAATGALISEGVSLFNKYSGYYSTLNASNMNLAFNRTRAGLVNNGRGTEN